MGLTGDADALLEASYNEAGGSVEKPIALEPMAAKLRWEVDRVVEAYGYLERRELVRSVHSAAYVLTVRGVDAVEKQRPAPQKQRQRLEYLTRSYDLAGGDPGHVLHLWTVGEELGWGRETTSETYEYLAEHGFLEARALGGYYSITDAAVDLFERAQADPDSPTGQFPPLSSLEISGGLFIGSNVASPGASVKTGDITVVQGVAVQEVRDALRPLAEAIGRADLDAAGREDALEHVQSLEAECSKPQPNRTVLRALWAGLQRLVPEVIKSAASAAAAALVRRLVEGG